MADTATEALDEYPRLEERALKKARGVWFPVAAAIFALLSDLLDDGDESLALEAALEVDLDELLTKLSKELEVILAEAALFGIGNASKVSKVDLDEHDEIFEALEGQILRAIRNRLPVALHGRVKRDGDMLGLGDVKDIGETIIANALTLALSRAASWGFLLAAQEGGIMKYKLVATIDDRTSMFCRFIHGKTFVVRSALRRIERQLSTTDPDDLRAMTPWPKQDPGALRRYEGYTTAQLARMGYNVPPFHPRCRTICVLVDWF